MDAVLPGLLGGTAGTGAGITSTVDDTPAPVDRDSCSLFGSTALTVQGLMALLVLTSLVIKRYREHPQRPWRVWMGDVSKQIIGQGFLHSTNILFSTLMSHHGSKNACTAYFLSILIDCTLGVLIIYAVLRIFSYILIDRLHLPGFKNGQYYEHQKARYPGGDGLEDDMEQEEQRGALGDESGHGHGHGENGQDSSEGEKASADRFHISWWGRQLLVYLLVLVVMKLAILGLFWIPAIFTVGDWLLSWLGEDTKIVFVLMIFPLAMNAFQFLLIDTILKSKPAHGSPALARRTSSSSGGPSSRRPGDGEADDDDDEEQRAFLATSPTQETSDRMAGVGSGSGGSRPLAASAADQSVLLRTEQGEEDARSLRGGSLLPSYRESGSAPPLDTRKEGQGQASPSYPPPSLYGSSGSSHTLVEKAGASIPAHRSIDIKLGEKLMPRPAEALAPVSSGLGMQRQLSQGSEAEGDGWNWLDDADADDDDERTEVGASSAPSKSIWAVSTPRTGMERTPSQRMASAV